MYHATMDPKVCEQCEKGWETNHDLADRDPETEDDLKREFQEHMIQYLYEKCIKELGEKPLAEEEPLRLRNEVATLFIECFAQCIGDCLWKHSNARQILREALDSGDDEELPHALSILFPEESPMRDMDSFVNLAITRCRTIDDECKINGAKVKKLHIL